MRWNPSTGELTAPEMTRQSQVNLEDYAKGLKVSGNQLAQPVRQKRPGTLAALDSS